MIKLYVNNTSTTIDGPWEILSDDKFKDQLRLRLGFKDANAHFRAKNRPGYDGVTSTLCYARRYCKCAIKKDGLHFPSGLLNRVTTLLDMLGLPYERYDLRPKFTLDSTWSVDPETCEPRDYQLDIVDKGTKWGRGIVKLATGGGKTGTAARLIAALGAFPFIFYVPSKDLLKQAQREFERFILHNNLKIKVGAVGGGQRDIQDITVMTIQTAIRALCPEAFEPKKTKTGKISKAKPKKEDRLLEDDGDDEEEEGDELGEFRKEVKTLIQEAKGYIADEVQHWASKTCQLIADHSMSARYRYGFSATPWRDMGDDMLIDACFGGTICDINASYLIDRNYLVPPSIFFVTVDNKEDIEYPDYATAYTEGMVENELRNTWIANVAGNLTKDGRMILILVKHILHGEILESMIPGSVFINGSHTGTVREEHLRKMSAHQAPITIASTIFDEGIDVRPLDGVILAGGGKSRTRALQRVGRAIRPYTCDGYTKTDAVVIDFYDDMKWMRQHSNDRRKIYNTEPRFAVKTLKF